MNKLFSTAFVETHKKKSEQLTSLGMKLIKLINHHLSKKTVITFLILIIGLFGIRANLVQAQTQGITGQSQGQFVVTGSSKDIKQSNTEVGNLPREKVVEEKNDDISSEILNKIKPHHKLYSNIAIAGILLGSGMIGYLKYF